MRTYLFISLFLFSFSFVFAQDVVFENEVKDYNEVGEKGPNLKKFNHTYLTYGFVFGENMDGAKIKYGGSGFTEFGFRHKRKFNNVFSAGYSLNTRINYFSLRQETGKIVPDTIINKKEFLNFYSVGADLYFRTNFSKRRGNLVGFYLDLGVRGDFTYYMLHQTKNQVNNIRSKTNRYGYDFYLPYTYGPTIRLGYNQFALSASYRYSDMFKSSTTFPELPRILIGIEIGTF
jgi:hypothetical protein